METFLINLEKDTDRLAYMHEQLTRLGIAYTRVDAFTGTSLEAARLYSATDAKKENGRSLSLGEIGCALSHRSIYETMVEKNIPHALVLEDDVLLPANFKAIIEEQVRRNHRLWEYLLFDYWQPGKSYRAMWYRAARIRYVQARKRGTWHLCRYVLGISLKGAYILPLSFFEAARNSLKRYVPGPVTFFRPLYLAGAYLITIDGARKLLTLSTPLRFPADAVPNIARAKARLRFKAYAPLCVRQRKEEFGSSIMELTGNEVRALLSTHNVDFPL